MAPRRSPAIFVRSFAIVPLAMLFGCALASKQVATESTAPYFAQTEQDNASTKEPNSPAEAPTPPEPEVLPPPVDSSLDAVGVTLADLEQLAQEQHPKLISA